MSKWRNRPLGPVAAARPVRDPDETEVRQAFYPIQKFDYSIAHAGVRDLWPSPI